MSDALAQQRLLDLLNQFNRTVLLGLKVPHKLRPDHFRRTIWKDRGLGTAIAENVASLGFTADAARLRRALDNFYGIVDPPVSVPTQNNPYLFRSTFVGPLHRRVEELAAVLADVRSLVAVEDQAGGKRDNAPAVEVEDRSKHPWGDDDPEAPFPPATLADRLGIPTDDRKKREALRKRLESWRNDHPSSGAGWIEAEGAAGRNPKYIYKIGKVWSVIEDMKPSG